MTSKLSQRCHIFLIIAAILALLIIIVLVWTMYGNLNGGNAKESGFNKGRRIGDNSTRVSQEVVSENDIPKEEESERAPEKEDKKNGSNVEFIRLVKISPLPLHDRDIWYDQRNNDTVGELVIRHSGHYRHKTAEIWDPHPEYKITAFGRDIHLQLFHDLDSVVAHPDLDVTHFFENVTQRVRHDSKISGCFYNGKVKDEPDSAVAVSLCHGMLGYIHSSKGNFYIEPYEEFVNSSTPLLHKITQITNRDEGVHGEDNCESNGEIFDEITTRPRRKRALHFDYVEDLEDVASPRRIRGAPKKTAHGFRRAARRKRTGREYFIELLIVADRSMLAYHGTRDNLVHYVLTLMSHVSFLFKEATIGNPITLTVVKIFIDTVTDYKNYSSNDQLANFCRWQWNNSLIGGSHDAALLLTRNPICGNDRCHTLGVAEVGAMCSESSSCALSKDNGLSTSYTIAHEIGHLLSMVHDETHHCINIPGGPHKGIMTKSLTNGSTPWKWSLCSNHFLTEFLDSPRSSCLLKRSSTSHIRPKLNSSLPGEYYEVDRQCELGFGLGSTLCSFMPSDVCKILWCTNPEGGCQTQHMPWADGTKCNEESWCHNRQCVRKDLRSLTPVNGQWGPWKGWSECSRDCGGGVATSKRHCDSPPPANGGSYCIGENTKYVSCNTHDCPFGEPDFREIQCAKFNGDTRGIEGLTSDVKWIPKYGIHYDADNCKLTCRVKNSPQYYTLRPKVVDGTKCSVGGFGICVNGACRPGGCDNRLGSGVRLDECGVCAGDNGTCREIAGRYNYTSRATTESDPSSDDGYAQIVRIPRGSFNVYVEQIAHGNDTKNDSYIALADGETGHYLINHDYTISSFRKDIYYGGIHLSYSGSENITETVVSERHQKLQKDLIVAVLNIYGHPPNIFYKYTIDKEIAPKYGWHLWEGNWTECDSACDGKQSMLPVCVNLDNGYHVDVEFCSNLSLASLKKERTCNNHCELIWKKTGNGICSSNCDQGVREIYYDCFLKQKNEKDSEGTLVDRYHCRSIPKPHFRYEGCAGTCENAFAWSYDGWSRCSKSCGGGVKSRTAKCVDSDNQTVSDSLCSSQEKVSIEACNSESCPHWRYGDWTQCSVPCGAGVRMRSYYCVRGSEPVSQMFCDVRKLDAIRERCEAPAPACEWHPGPWSRCSGGAGGASCGPGRQSRQVLCRARRETVREAYCARAAKPEATRRCDLGPSCERRPTTYRGVDDNEIPDEDYYDAARWDTGPWSTCSATCGGGVRLRQVVCRDEADGGVVAAALCEEAPRPAERSRCAERACPPRWAAGAYGACDARACERRRAVACEDAAGRPAAPSECDAGARPPSATGCEDPAAECAGYRKAPKGGWYRWRKAAWGPCSTGCGRGTQIRKVSCRDERWNATVVDRYCSSLRKPKSSRPCEVYNCHYAWAENHWSKCSKPCDDGIRYRNVTCHKTFSGKLLYNHLVHPNKCEEALKPASQEKCIERRCEDKFRWVTSNWTKCPETCGNLKKKPFQTRRLSCVNLKNQKVSVKHCPKAFKPQRKRTCIKYPCSNYPNYYSSCKEIKDKTNNSTNSDYSLLIDGKLATVYCYKMDTRHPEEFVTLHPSRRNYAAFFDKRLNSPETCVQYPNFGDCHCHNISTDMVGHTEFWKVRLNLTDMRIVVDDFTFSSTNLNRQKYGHAGDCYSEIEDCIEGSFSVDLSETSFRIARSVQWFAHGNVATQHIHRIDERHVYGRCGGNCGSCLPDPAHGLLVEVT